MADNQYRQLMTQEQQTALAEIADDATRKQAQIFKAMLPNGNKITDIEALAGAMYAKLTGLNPIDGSFYIIPGLGVCEGYKGKQQLRAEKTRFNYFYRMMSPDERELHEVGDKDIGVICVFTDVEMAGYMTSKGLAYHPTEGVGVLREDEKYNTEQWGDRPGGGRTKYKLPRDKWTPAEATKGRSWLWKCQQRALKDALNHTPGFEHLAEEMSETPEEVLTRAEAEIPGYEAPPATARLTVEQARAWADHERRYAPQRNDPAARQAWIESGRERMRLSHLQREWDDWVFRDMACPYCGVRSQAISEHRNDCQFRQLFPNSALLPEPPAPDPALDIEDGTFSPIDEETVAPTAELPAASRDVESSADGKRLAEVHAKFVTYGAQSAAPASEAQRKAAGAALAGLFGHNGGDVQAFLQWAYGKSAVNELTGAQASAMIKFVASTKQSDGTYVPCDQAVAVAGAFRRMALGHKTLFEEEQ